MSTQTEPIKEVELSKSIGDRAVDVAIKQLEAGERFMQPRMSKIKLIEETYAFKEKPALAGKYNIPFDSVILKGFVDSVMAKIDEPPKLEFGNTKEAAYKGAKKVSAAAQFELSSSRSNLAQRDRWGKKLAILSGRSIFKVWGEASPFKFNVRNTDHYDFVCEPGGGGNLDDHIFKYQKNIFRTKSELKAGVTDGRYDGGQVQKLITWTPPKDVKENQDEYQNKASRYAAIGLDIDNNNYVGETLFNLVEGTLIFEGQKLYIVFDRKSRIWVRCSPIEEAFESTLDPWVSYGTDDDAFGFWTNGPSDPMYAIGEARRINLNAMLNNARKIADDMIVYDVKSITDPSKLIYAPERLIGATLRDGRTLQDVVHRLAPRDITTLAINIEKFMNDFSGQMSGITPGAQGNGTEKLATIYEGNIQEAQDRIGLLNRSYAEAHERIGRLFDWALYEHADSEYMVKVIGNNGVDWDKLTDEDKDPDYEVKAVGARAEQQANAMKQDRQKESLTLITGNPVLLAQVSAKKAAEETLRFGGYNDEEIRVWMDTKNEGSQEILSEAARMIQNIVEGEPYKPFKGATTGFVKKIMDYASQNGLEDDVYWKLMAAAKEHIPIAQENMARDAMLNPTPANPMTPPSSPVSTPPNGQPNPGPAPAPQGQV